MVPSEGDRPFMKELTSRTDGQVKRLIEQAMIYMQKNYMRDISLDNCADTSVRTRFS